MPRGREPRWAFLRSARRVTPRDQETQQDRHDKETSRIGSRSGCSDGGKSGQRSHNSGPVIVECLELKRAVIGWKPDNRSKASDGSLNFDLQGEGFLENWCGTTKVKSALSRVSWFASTSSMRTLCGPTGRPTIMSGRRLRPPNARAHRPRSHGCVRYAANHRGPSDRMPALCEGSRSDTE